MTNRIILLICFFLSTMLLSAQLIIKEEPVVLSGQSCDIHGTLRVPYSKKAIRVALIIAGSGPTDRDGNQPVLKMKSNSLKMLAEGLYYNNIATLCFDKRAIGESKMKEQKGEDNLRFEDYINDAKSLVSLLADDKRFSEVIIIGHSEGSLIGMVAAEENKKVSKYVSLAGSGMSAGDILREQLADRLKSQPHVRDMAFSYIDKLEKGETVSDVPQYLYSIFRPSVQPYMISWLKYNPQKEIAKLTIPVLIVQGTKDVQVSVNHADLLAKANGKAKKLIIEGMDHVLKNSESMDVKKQMETTYKYPTQPVKKELIEGISTFIKN